MNQLANRTTAQPTTAGSRSIPAASSFTSAPLRNRLRVELKAPIAQVWALTGDIARLPEYSAGLEHVDVKTNSSGAPTEYVCHFRPLEEGGAGMVSRELVRWYEPNRGWASVAEEPNEHGLRNSFHLVTLVPSSAGTILTWDAHFDAENLDMNRAALDQALADIGERLIARFGGHVVERYVEAPR